MGDVNKTPFQVADDQAKAKRKRVEKARKQALALAEEQEAEFLRTQQADLRREFYERQAGRAA